VTPARPGGIAVGRITPTPTPVPRTIMSEDSAGWMIRMSRSGEVFRFRELTTLQQWIVERKVNRDDEISRTGDQWKKLGGIAELASFFHIVEQAAVLSHNEGSRPTESAKAVVASPRLDEDPALTTTAPMARDPSGPTAMGNRLHHDEPAFARSHSSSAVGLTPPSLPQLTGEDDELEPRPRRRAGLWAGLVAATVLLGTGGYLAMFKRDAVRGLIAQHDARGEENYRRGREYFLLDSDDAYRNALAEFQRAHALDDKSALPLAGLAEVEATWAQYLRDDARSLETGTPSLQAAAAVKTMRREAQAHLDQAKKLAADALNADPDAPEVNRAMADYLRVDGAPAAEVQRYLERAAAKRPNDAEAVYVAGALALRDGKLDEAKAKLAQANQLNQAATQHALLRASMLLARVDMQTGDREGARLQLQTVLAANKQHDRAAALQAQLEAEGAAAAPAVAAAASGTTVAPSGPTAAGAATAPAASGAAATPTGATVAAAPSGSSAARAPVPLAATVPAGGAPAVAPSKSEGGGGDYARLVQQADRLSENGHGKDARKLYEKALQLQPNGLDAMTGLAYCELDGEKFSAAVEHFKRALGISPGYGEAIIGLAEAYKLRGDRKEALGWYKQYLDKLPNGPKAAMAKNNIRDLEPRGATTAPAAGEVKEPAAAGSPEELKKNEPAKPAAPGTKDEPPAADEKPTQLPRLPTTNDEPPP
jgi:Tfp pilus assembly protein PilF